MTIIYIILGALSALLFAGSACIVFKAGEKENICQYNYKGDKKQ